jgi:hypothetical protein
MSMSQRKPPQASKPVVDLTGQVKGQSEVVGAAIPWKSAAMAKLWFKDARAAADRSDPDARRHEIVFSVFFAESWLFEWVRDCVLHGPIPTLILLANLFPPSKANLSAGHLHSRVPPKTP